MGKALHIAGTLGSSDFPDLLQWLARAGQSGTLVVTRKASDHEVEKRLVFSKGRIISTASTEPHEYLGHFLVGHGHLDENLLAKAIEMQQSNKMLLGKILLTLGAIGEQDLEAMLRMKAEETVYDVFTWVDAEFEFRPGQLPEAAMVPLELEVEGLLLQGAQRVDEWESARELIPSTHCVPVSVRELLAEENDEADQAILDLVNDDRTVEEIVLQSHRSEFAVYRVLAMKVRDGSLKIIKPRQLRVEAPREAAATAGARPPGAQQLLRQALQDLRAGELDSTLKRLKEARESPDRDETTSKLAAQVEESIRGALEKAGLTQEAVLELAHGIPDASSSLSAQEGFLLSRIDGRFDVRAICKITPLPMLETLVALWKLLHAGHVKVR